MKLDASFLVKLNTINSLIVLALSFFQFKNTILPGFEIYVSMFLAVISLTFNNQINYGSKKLTWAATTAIGLIVLIQMIYLDYSLDVLLDKHMSNLFIILSSLLTVIIFIYYLLSKRIGY